MKVAIIEVSSVECDIKHYKIRYEPEEDFMETIKPLKKYVVVSPLIEESCSAFFAEEPIEEFVCLVEVKAKNKREAKIKAIKTEEFKPWIKWQKADSANPFTGLKVFNYDDFYSEE